MTMATDPIGPSVARNDPVGTEVLTPQEALKLLYLTHQGLKARGKRTRFARVQFVAANRGDGTSSIARDFALIAAQRVHDRVLLMDLGVPTNSQLRWAEARGRLQGPADLAPVEFGLPVELPREQHGDVVTMSTWVRFHRFRNASLFVSERYEAAHATGEGAEPAAMGDFWEKLRRDFQLVVVDTLAVSESFDPIMLSNQMDAVILVVGAESTRAPVAQNLRDRIAEVGGPIIGVVLNRRRFHIPNFLYRRL